jgi:hypothetical protein
MSVYDGDDFGAIDATAYADGKPSCQWLRKKIENNIAFLFETSPPVTVYRLGGPVESDAEGPYFEDTAICSIRQSVFFAVPVYVDMNTAEIVLAANIITPTAEVYISGKVMEFSGRIIGSTEEFNVEAPSVFYAMEGIGDVKSYKEFRVPINPNSTGYVLAFLTIRSKQRLTSEGYYVPITGNLGAPDDYTIDAELDDGNYDFDPEAAPDPDTDNPIALDVSVYVSALGTGNNRNQKTDILGFVNKGDGEYLTSLDRSIFPRGGELTADYLLFSGPSRISYAQARSCTVQVIRKYNLRDAELRFGLVERGLDNLRQANSTLNIRRDRRMIAAGPSGRRPPSAKAGRIWRWEHVFSGAASSTQPANVLIRTHGAEPLEGGYIEMVMVVAVSAHRASGIGQCDYEFDLKLDSLAGTETSSRKTTSRLSAIGTQQPQEDMPGWVHRLQAFIFWNSTSESSEPYACREGQMVDWDFGQLNLVKIKCPVPETGNGYGIEVTAKFAGEVEGLSEDDIDAEIGYHLTCVSWAAYLVPE